MAGLSPDAQQELDAIASRHGFSQDAVRSMLDAVAAGRGGMAQFSHPEFGGSGQWMQGGMTMIGDMFNNNLKYRVVSLCDDLSAFLSRQPNVVIGGSFQSQNQGAPGGQSTGGWNGGWNQPNWWPDGLGAPSTSGGQNDMRYAYFPDTRRLAIDEGGQVTVYDTGNHQIGGVSQQQSGGRSLTLTSQFGNVDLASLPIVSGAGFQPQQPSFQQPPAFQQPPPLQQPSYQEPSYQQPAYQPPPQSGTGSADVFATLEKLADLRAKGVLSDEEFAAKKNELLSRL